MPLDDEFRECNTDIQAYFNRMLVKYPTDTFIRAICLHVACIISIQEEPELAGEAVFSEMMDTIKKLNNIQKGSDVQKNASLS